MSLEIVRPDDQNQERASNPVPELYISALTHETTWSQERRYQFSVGAFIVDGPPGIGKSTAKTLIAAMYGITSWSTGDLIRDEVKRRTGQEMIGFQERTPERDLEIDEMQMHRYLNASPDAPFAVDSHLGAFLVHEMRQSGANPPVVTILLRGDPERIIQRAYERDRQKQEMTYKEYRKLILERRQKDLEQWHSLYPHLNYDPANPKNEDDFGNKIHDIVVDTTDKEGNDISLEAIMHILHQEFIAKGIVKEVPPNGNGGKTVFEAA